jgi:hypothetical protein
MGLAIDKEKRRRLLKAMVISLTEQQEREKAAETYIDTLFTKAKSTTIQEEKSE